MKTAIIPGSFDPITVGHLDIIQRASHLFDRVIVLVIQNRNKGQGMFDITERATLIEKSIANLENVEVNCWRGLLVDAARKYNADAIIKGVRALTDLEYELAQASANKQLNPNVETVFMPTRTAFSFISSSMVREVVSYGGNIDKFVPSVIIDDVNKHKPKSV